MSEYINKNEPNDVFAEFDKLSDDFKKTSIDTIEEIEENAGTDKLTPLQQRRRTRSERLSDKKSGNFVHTITDKIESLTSRLTKLAKRDKKNVTDGSELNMEGSMAKNSSKKKATKKKYRINIKKLILVLFSLFLVCVIGVSIWIYSILRHAVDIDPNNINAMLSENSVLFDNAGNAIDDIFNSPDGRRTNVNFADIPPDLINAFIAVEDRTFWDHSGVNVIRLVGAVRDAALGDGRIRGTSTITQQLARNIFLPETRLERTLDRKILEIYYALIIERYLTKEQIIEAYLNTIQLGFRTSGVQAAAQAYFSKDVGELNLLESIALAALPQAPSAYALVRALPNESVAEDNENILVRGNTFTYLYNGDASAHRRALIIRLMNEQGFITDEQAQAAREDDLRYHISPRQDVAAEGSSYFVDFVRQQVLRDLMREFYLDEEEANMWLNNRGLRIHTTLDSRAQNIIEAEFANNANFPSVANLNRVRDSAGNILGPNRNILLYHYNNYFDAEGNFTLTPDEFERLPDGSLKIFGGNRLNFFRTEVRGQVDYSVEFRNMYIIEDGIFYSINGGFISIAREYKTRDSDGNLIVSAQFFVDRPNFFTESENGLTIASTGYALQQRVVQPQSAMVILDHQTGEIRAMVGGRQIIGRMLFNRADSPRQPGSSIKPIGVYAPALQLSVDALNNGRTIFPPSSDESVDHLYGQFWTAGSVIDDAPMTVGGRQWPRNWYNAFLGLSSMRVSIEQSINVAAVKVLNEITPEFSSQFLQRIGVSTIELSGSVNDINAAALALGGMTRGISPLEMAGAFGSIANRGAYVEPISYTKVTNRNGDILLQNIPITTQAMDPGVAFITQDMLRTNVTVGTNQQAAIGTQPVAGKTGTTNDNFDAWFVGFTPQYTASLWIGNDVNIQLSQGSVAASRLWSRIMRQVSEGLPTGQLASAPPNVISVTIDTTSGMLPSEISAFGHRGSRSEFFIRGTEPQEVDNVHVFVNVCTHSWHLATPLCPHTVAAFGVRRPYVPDPAVRDFRFEVPHFYCFVHNPDPNLYPINTNAPWEFDWEGRHHTQESEPELDPDELDEPDEPNDMPPIDDMPVNRDPDEDLGENVIDSNIYDDLPEFLRN